MRESSAVKTNPPTSVVSGVGGLALSELTSQPSKKILINRRTLAGMVPLSERCIFDLEKRGEFPRRIVLTARNVAWYLHEVEEWIEAKRASNTRAQRPGVANV